MGVRRRDIGWQSEWMRLNGRNTHIRMQFVARGTLCGDWNYGPIDRGVLDAGEEGRELGLDVVAIGLCTVRVDSVLRVERVVFAAEIKEDENVGSRGQRRV